MEDLWGPIEVQQWRNTPCVQHRQATEQDVREGRAVFHVGGAVEVAEIPLPACGYQRMDDGSEQPVVVVQAEVLPDGTLFGVRPLSGGNGICFANEVRLLSGGFEESLAS
jgi:hypothetical protein